MDKSGEVRYFEHLFDRREAEIKLVNFDINDPICWVKLNPRLTGFYRVQYGEKLFRCLLRNLQCDKLTAIDRMGLFDDQVI